MSHKGETGSRRPSLALVVSCVALLSSMIGVAFAVPLNSVKSKHIVDGEVRTQDLRASAIHKSHIQDNAVGTDELANNKLHSIDIDTASVRGNPHVANFSLTTDSIREMSLNTGRGGVAQADGPAFLGTSSEVILSEQLPAGTYMVLASASLFNNPGNNETAFCAIFANGSSNSVGSNSEAILDDEGEAGWQDFVVANAFVTVEQSSPEPLPVDLRCGAGDDGDVRYRDAHLGAILMPQGGTFVLPGKAG